MKRIVTALAVVIAALLAAMTLPWEWLWPILAWLGQLIIEKLIFKRFDVTMVELIIQAAISL